MEQKTHWKKNVDTRYISGEDLQNGTAIAKGLQSEMLVEITGQSDAEAYDQGKQEKIIRTALVLRDLKTKQRIYKPILLNKTLALFFAGEFKSDFLEDWFAKPFILFANADKRHGFVVAARKYVVQKKPLHPDNMELLKTKMAAKETTMDVVEKFYNLTETQREELKNA